MITQETIDKILSTARIEEVVSDFVKLKKRGVNFLGNCPFHNEKTPSFTVSPTKEIFKCFGCGKAGNTVSFVMEHEKITYPEALRYLAEKYKIEIDETVPGPAAQLERTERESLYIVLEAAQKYYADNLLNTDEGKAIALSYFKERKLTEATIKNFGLGWSSPGWDNFSQWAIKNSYTKDFLLKTGLSIETQDGKLVDRFRERVLFPIHNISGKVLGFGGRILKSVSGKEAKYINSPETEVYNKSKVLYGISQAKKAIRQQDSCILVEGYMDVLSLYQRGVENVVASSGTSLTEEQLKLVKRFTENIYFLFDGDVAGQKAALRGVDLALEQGLNVKVVVLPVEHDPDSFAKEHDKEEIEEYINANAQDFVTFKTGLLLKDSKNDPDKKSKAIKEIINSLALIPDQISRSLYIKIAEKALEVDEKLLYEELRRHFISKFKEENKTPEINISEPPVNVQQNITVSLKSTLSQERQVVKNLLIFGDKPFSEETSVAAYMLSELAEVEWENPNCKRLFEEVRQALEKQPEGLDFSYFVNVEDPELQKFVSDLVIEAHKLDEGWKKFLQRPVVAPADNYIEEVTSALNHFKLRMVMKLIKENEKDLKNSSTNEEVDQLLTVHMHLTDMKKQLCKEMGIILV